MSSLLLRMGSGLGSSPAVRHARCGGYGQIVCQLLQPTSVCFLLVCPVSCSFMGDTGRLAEPEHQDGVHSLCSLRLAL